MERPIKIAQIGTGHDHASQAMVCTKRYPEFFEVVGVAECNTLYYDRLHSDPAYADIPHYSVEELLNISGLEAVVVETDELSAAMIAEMCIERGLPIHLDKPGGYEYADFERFMLKAKKNKIPVHLGYMYRYNPFVIDAIKMKNDGVFGEIYSVEAQMSVYHDLSKRKWLSNFKGGMTYFLGCHLVDLVMQLQGEPEDVIPFNCSTMPDNAEVGEDFGFAVMKYRNGVSFIKTCGCEVNGFARRQLVICGSKGTFEIKPFEIIAPDLVTGLKYTRVTSQGNLTVHTDCTNNWADSGEHIESKMQGRFDDMLREFAEIVAGHMENPYSHDYEIKLFKNVLKAAGRAT